MNEGRKAAWQMAGGWLLLGWGSVQKHEWRLQAGGSAQGAQTRLAAWRTAVSVHVRAGTFLLGLFIVYRLDVYADLQIISH